MRVKEVAKRLDVSGGSVYGLIAAGKLKCYRVGLGRGCIRVSEEQLAEYLRAAESAPLAAPPARPIRLKHLRLP
jgi:excisionase family DNA binding protein